MGDLEFMLLGVVGSSVLHSAALLTVRSGRRGVAQGFLYLAAPFLFTAFVGASFAAPEVLGVSKLWGIPVLLLCGYSVGFWHGAVKEAVNSSVKGGS